MFNKTYIRKVLDFRCVLNEKNKSIVINTIAKALFFSARKPDSKLGK